MKNPLWALGLLGLLMPLVMSNFDDTEQEYKKEAIPTRYGMVTPPAEVTDRSSEYRWMSERFNGYDEKTGFFTGTLVCPDRDIFCATLTYEFMDNDNETNFLTYVPIHCTNDGTLRHSAMVVFEKQEQLFDNGNDTFGTPIVRILHTCFNAFRVGEQVQVLPFPIEFEANKYELNLTVADPLTKPTTAEKANFPIEWFTKKWLNRIDVYGELRQYQRFAPVTVRSIMQEKPLPYSLYTAYNSVVNERRCQHSTFHKHIYCSKTLYAYDGRNRKTYTHNGVKFGSNEDEFLATALC